MKAFLTIVMICYCLTLSSCGGYSAPAAGQPSGINMAGTWQFTFTSSKGGSMTASGSLSQTGGTVSGTLNLTGSCTSSGSFSGSVSVYALSFTLTQTGEMISLSGSVATDSSSANGSYQVTSATGACASAIGDSGTWSGTRTTAAASAAFVGSIQPPDRMPVGVTIRITTPGTQATGIADFTSSACMHSVNLDGTTSDSAIDLSGENGDSSITLQGILDKNTKTMNMTSTVTGACQAESGVGSLTKVSP